MKFVKRFAILLALLPIVSFAQAQNPTVPFYGVEVFGGKKMEINYDFNPHKQTLICYTFSEASSFGEWSYKGKKISRVLPSGGAIVLKGDALANGDWADPKGKLTFTNVNTAGPTLILNCEYR